MDYVRKYFGLVALALLVATATSYATLSDADVFLAKQKADHDVINKERRPFAPNAPSVWAELARNATVKESAKILNDQVLKADLEKTGPDQEKAIKKARDHFDAILGIMKNTKGDFYYRLPTPESFDAFAAMLGKPPSTGGLGIDLLGTNTDVTPKAKQVAKTALKSAVLNAKIDAINRIIAASTPQGNEPALIEAASNLITLDNLTGLKLLTRPLYSDPPKNTKVNKVALQQALDDIQKQALQDYKDAREAKDPQTFGKNDPQFNQKALMALAQVLLRQKNAADHPDGPNPLDPNAPNPLDPNLLANGAPGGRPGDGFVPGGTGTGGGGSRGGGGGGKEGGGKKGGGKGGGGKGGGGGDKPERSKAEAPERPDAAKLPGPSENPTVSPVGDLAVADGKTLGPQKADPSTYGQAIEKFLPEIAKNPYITGLPILGKMFADSLRAPAGARPRYIEGNRVLAFANGRLPNGAGGASGFQGPSLGGNQMASAGSYGGGGASPLAGIRPYLDSQAQSESRAAIRPGSRHPSRGGGNVRSASRGQNGTLRAAYKGLRGRQRFQKDFGQMVQGPPVRSRDEIN